MTILHLARLYQLRLRQSLTIPHQNPHRPVRKVSVRKILVVGQIYRYTFAVAVAIPMRAVVVIDGDVEGFTHEQLAAKRGLNLRSKKLLELHGDEFLPEWLLLLMESPEAGANPEKRHPVSGAIILPSGRRVD